MTTSKLAFIVEGFGEQKALPNLISRIAQSLNRYDISINENHDIKNAKGKQNILKKGGLETFLHACNPKIYAGILILIDADELCPKELANNLYQRIKQFNPQIPVAIVCAKCEYEAWFLANLDTLIEVGLLTKGTHYPIDKIEEKRDVKGWLNAYITDDKYNESKHQLEMTRHINFEQTRPYSRSFRRLEHAIAELLHAIDSSTITITPSF